METKEAWETIGGDARVKRIRQGGVYLYVFLDGEGGPVGSHWVPVREVEAPAEFRIDPEVFAAVSSGIGGLLESIRARYVDPIGAQGPQGEGQDPAPVYRNEPCPRCGARLKCGIAFGYPDARCEACGTGYWIGPDGKLLPNDELYPERPDEEPE